MSVPVPPIAGSSIRLDLKAPGFNENRCFTHGDHRENDPVHWSAEGQGWVVTRYEDVVQTLGDSRLSVDFERYGPAHLPDEELAAQPTAHLYGMFSMPNDEHSRNASPAAPHKLGLQHRRHRLLEIGRNLGGIRPV